MGAGELDLVYLNIEIVEGKERKLKFSVPFKPYLEKLMLKLAANATTK